MESLKLNLQSSDFSLLETTDSQILASSHPLSIPSEPPDLRNWFPSYHYESPVLNSNSFLDEFVMHESTREEKEENSGVLRRNVNKDDAFGHKKQNSNGVVKSGSSSGNKHEYQCLSKIPGSFKSPSFMSDMSEPTDIRNWFSSYVYESPSLDTTDGFGDSICKESKNEKHGFLVEKSKENEKDLGDFSKHRGGSEKVVSEKVQSQGLAKCNSSWRDTKQEEQPVSEVQFQERQPVIEACPSRGENENLRGQNDLCLDNLPIISQNHAITPAQDVEMSFLSKESSQCMLEHKLFSVTGLKPSNNQRTSCSDHEKSPQYMTHSKDFTLQDRVEAKVHAEVDCFLFESGSELMPSSGPTLRKSTRGSKDRNESNDDGFISTRKGKLLRKNDENFVEGPQEICKAGAMDCVMKRKALADATNCHHSPVMGITGKWKCPQKSKPNLGPSLKQLRLEQWVRKL